MCKESFPVGKLPNDFLSRILKMYAPADDARIVVGPGVGEDATVLDLGNQYLVAKCDPVTFATDRIGWYAVNVNANDLAVMGAVPKWFLATILLPEGKADSAMVESIFQDLSDSCAKLGITLCGGHTEITYGLDRPILSGHLLGEVARDRLVTSAGAEPGDSILLTKGIAIEGTAILAHEKGEELQGVLDDTLLVRAAGFLDVPGISVVRDAAVLMRTVRPKAMHDPTEGGLATALSELATAAGVGLRIEESAVPVLPETATICKQFALSPWGLIASGALLAVVQAGDLERALAAYQEAGIPAAKIGEVVGPEEGLRLLTPGGEEALPAFAADELGRVFGGE